MKERKREYMKDVGFGRNPNSETQTGYKQERTLQRAPQFADLNTKFAKTKEKSH